MKKILSVLLVLVMVLSFAACAPAGNEDTGNTQDNTGNTNESNTNENSTGESKTDENVPASALEILQNIWALYGENDKFFAMGGDYTTPVENEPGAVDVSTADFLTGSLIVPEAEAANVTEAASLLHSMNANTFTGAAYKVSDVKAFATAMQTAIQGNQWMCGFPEKLLIASVGGDYVVVAFGHSDIIPTFKTNLTTAYPAAEILVEENIGG